MVVMPPHHETSQARPGKKTVLVKDQLFRFEDPWGMSMSDKLQFLPLKDELLFLDRWKMYSHISHASAFSVWPRWVDPAPRFDSIQCLALVANVAAKFLNRPFDSTKFLETAWTLLGSVPEKSGVDPQPPRA